MSPEQEEHRKTRLLLEAIAFYVSGTRLDYHEFLRRLYAQEMWPVEVEHG